jgi:hypothetical protein
MPLTKPVWSNAEIRTLAWMLAAEIPAKLAPQYGLNRTPDAIWSFVRRNRWNKRHPSQATLDAAVAMIQSGVSIRKAAQAVGVSHNCIWAYYRGKRRRHDQNPAHDAAADERRFAPVEGRQAG